MSAVCVIEFPRGGAGLYRAAARERARAAWERLQPRAFPGVRSRAGAWGASRSHGESGTGPGALALAVRAPHGRALADHGLLQRPAAGRARFAAAAVGAQFLLEVARRAVGGDEVAQRGSAALDGVAEDAAHGVGQQPV